MVCLGPRQEPKIQGYPDMPPSQRIIFVVGLLAAIALAATVAAILLHRAYPDNQWVTLVGPLGAAAAVIGLARVFFRT